MLRRDCTEFFAGIGFRQPPAHELSTTHSPCSSLHARLAECIATPAGRLLPHPFTLDPLSKLSCRATFALSMGRNTFCCGYSHTSVTCCAPSLAVSWGSVAWLLKPGVGKFL